MLYMSRLHRHVPIFRSGSRHQWHSSGSLLDYGLELVPMMSIPADKLGGVAGRLVEVAKNNQGVQQWLPGPRERYSTLESASEAIIRAGKRKDMLAWVIQRVVQPGSIEHDVFPSRVEGVATINSSVELFEQPSIDKKHRRVDGRYALAAFWASFDPLGDESQAISSAMFYSVANDALRNPERIVACLDGPVDLECGLPLDPGAAFSLTSEAWEDVIQLPGDRQQTADGIIPSPTTLIFRPKSL